MEINTWAPLKWLIESPAVSVSFSGTVVKLVFSRNSWELFDVVILLRCCISYFLSNNCPSLHRASAPISVAKAFILR